VQFRGETLEQLGAAVSIRPCWNVHRDGGTCDRAGRLCGALIGLGVAPRRRRRAASNRSLSGRRASTCMSITRSCGSVARSSRRCSSERPPVGPSAHCWPAWRRSRFRRCCERTVPMPRWSPRRSDRGWAEMLRDTIAAAAGLEQAIGACACAPAARAARGRRARRTLGAGAPDDGTALLRRRRRRSDLRPRRRVIDTCGRASSTSAR
jgi:hypothetical protein